MLILPKIGRSSRDNMESTFKAEIASVPADELPLDQGMRHASVATDNASGEAVGAMVIATEMDEHVLRLRAGLFHQRDRRLRLHRRSHPDERRARVLRGRVRNRSRRGATLGTTRGRLLDFEG